MFRRVEIAKRHMDLSKAWKLVDGTLDKKEGRVEYTATRRSRSEGTTSVHSVVLRGRPLHENEEFNKDYIMNSGFFVMYSTEVTEDTGGDVLILRDKTGGKKIRDQLAPMDFSDFEEAGTRKTFISFLFDTTLFELAVIPSSSRYLNARLNEKLNEVVKDDDFIIFNLSESNCF